ncbi:MAG: VWA domain-containing protein [Rikenellaceae bacterium]|jgi:hypothetical protein|nr:VWA domain-containing protein [Rikenellaceae bacterium]
MYKAPITRLHPTAFIVLIDRSGSMSEEIVFADQAMPKSHAVAIAANSFIDELLYRAHRAGEVYDYYDIAVLGYSGDGVSSLISPVGEFTRPSRLAVSNVRKERLSRERLLPDGRSVVTVTEQNMWIEPEATGATPMRAAMGEALTLLEKWCRRTDNRASYPPTVLNITDGEASDGGDDDIREIARRIRSTGTEDGGTLLVNIHLGRMEETVSVAFPTQPDQLPAHRYARLLWDISSEMPASYHDFVTEMRGETCGTPRGMSFNCPLSDVVAMMNIGSINSLML